MPSIGRRTYNLGTHRAGKLVMEIGNYEVLIIVSIYQNQDCSTGSSPEHGVIQFLSAHMATIVSSKSRPAYGS